MEKKHATLMAAMTAYDQGDVPRIQHFVKVHNFAATIAQLEGMDTDSLFVLETAAILHDIGIHVSEEKYGNCNGKYQEELGPDEARNLLLRIGGYTEDQIERVCFLIGHHHSYTNVTGLDWQILLEADFLVNSFEDHLEKKAIVHFRDKVFKTKSGIDLLNSMWGL